MLYLVLLGILLKVTHDCAFGTAQDKMKERKTTKKNEDSMYATRTLCSSITTGIQLKPRIVTFTCRSCCQKPWNCNYEIV
jgi:hypothetical protein